MTIINDGSSSTNSVRLRRTSASAVLGWALIAAGCNSSHVTNNYYPAPNGDAGDESDAAVTNSTAESSDAQVSGLELDAGPGEDETSAPTFDGGLDDAGDAGPAFTPANLELDMFGTYQNTFKFVVSEQQLNRLNERYDDGGPIFIYGPQYGDIYSPGGGG